MAVSHWLVRVHSSIVARIGRDLLIFFFFLKAGDIISRRKNVLPCWNNSYFFLLVKLAARSYLLRASLSGFLDSIFSFLVIKKGKANFILKSGEEVCKELQLIFKEVFIDDLSFILRKFLKHKEKLFVYYSWYGTKFFLIIRYTHTIKLLSL